MRNEWEVFGLLAAFRAPELRNNFSGEQRSEFIIYWEARRGWDSFIFLETINV